MIFNIWIGNKKAFSLLEMTIAVIIMTVLLTFAVPSMYRAYLEKAGTKTALEIQNIQDAARSFYLQKGIGWPSSINTPPNDLESSGYLPASWNALNPFNNSYTVSSTSALFTVATTVNDGAQNIVASKLPLTNVSGTIITSTIGLPGGPTTPPVYVVTGTIGNGATIPLPNGYSDSQCQWFVSSQNAEIYDSSGKGGCESLETLSAYLTGPNGRTAVATDTGDCRGSWSFNLNYIGICLS
jgi:prepilin-type N-terminal cleavage/methylation domain-containing protein